MINEAGASGNWRAEEHDEDESGFPDEHDGDEEDDEEVDEGEE